MTFILASQSPRRLELLAQIGITPDAVFPADIDESPLPTEKPRLYARRMASEKVAVVAGKKPDAIILGADTVVACGHRILPKAEDRQTADTCLRLLSGRRHRVITAIALYCPGEKIRVKLVASTVTFKRLSEDDIKTYLASDEWRGKAGGYAIQGLGARYIRALSGSYSGVVGLPLFEVAGWLTAAGVIKPGVIKTDATNTGTPTP